VRAGFLQREGRGGRLTLDTDEAAGAWRESLRLMALKHVVITSVNRDELKDGGAAIWGGDDRADKRTRVRALSIEVLIPDFGRQVGRVCRW